MSGHIDSVYGTRWAHGLEWRSPFIRTRRVTRGGEGKTLARASVGSASISPLAQKSSPASGSHGPARAGTAPWRPRTSSQPAVSHVAQ